MRQFVLLLASWGCLVTVSAQEFIVVTKQDGTNKKFAYNDRLDSIICTPQKQTLVLNLNNVSSVTNVTPSVVPGVLTISNIGAVSATVEDNLSLNTSCSFSEAGYCYSFENKMPTIVDQHVSTGLLSFRTYSLKKLKGNKTYYIRSYIKTANSCTYGSVASFTTRPYATMNFHLSEYFWTKATFKTIFSSSDDVVLNQKGICYATHTAPTMDDTFSETNAITGLTPKTVYYARAFTKVDQDVQYSPEIVFTTRALEDSVLVESEDPNYLSTYQYCTLVYDTVYNKNVSNNKYISAVPVKSTDRADVAFDSIPIHLGSTYTIKLTVVPVTVCNPDTTIVKPNKISAILTYQNASGNSVSVTLRDFEKSTINFTNDVTKIDEIELGTITLPVVNDPTLGTLTDGTIKLRIKSTATVKELDTYDSTLRLDCIKLKVVKE
jgi:hypothetical protein